MAADDEEVGGAVADRHPIVRQGAGEADLLAQSGRALDARTPASGSPAPSSTSTSRPVTRWRQAGFLSSDQPAYQVMEAATHLRPVARAAARRESGIHGSPAVLWVGRLKANKIRWTTESGFGPVFT